jgi:hypothetical protein
MSATIRIEQHVWHELVQAVSKPEHAAFMLAEVEESTFNIVDLRVMRAEDYESRSGLHLDLKDEVRPELISWAWERRLSLVEVHSHKPGFARFSRSDLWGFEEWVPHLWWRLKCAPYVALVKAGDEWDGMAWLRSAEEPEAVVGIEIVESLEVPTPTQVIAPTGATLAALRKAA